MRIHRLATRLIYSIWVFKVWSKLILGLNYFSWSPQISPSMRSDKYSKEAKQLNYSNRSLKEFVNYSKFSLKTFLRGFYPGSGTQPFPFRRHRCIFIWRCMQELQNHEDENGHPLAIGQGFTEKKCTSYQCHNLNLAWKIYKKPV